MGQNKAPLHIAVFRMSALGDCLMVLTAIRALLEHEPSAKITWIIDKAFLPLFDGEEGIQFLGIKKPRSLRDYIQLRAQLKDYSFDVLLAMQASLRSNLIYPLIQAKHKIGFDKQRGKELHGLFIDSRIPEKDEHLLEGFISFVSTLFGEFSSETYLKNILSEPSAGLVLKAQDKIWASDTLEGLKGKKILALNAAASKVERCCEPSFYSQVLKLAYEQGFVLLLTGGPAIWEVELSQNIESYFNETVVDKNLNQNAPVILNLVGKTSLSQLAAVLEQVDVLVAPDTGPAHLADLLGTQVIGLYAVAPPKQTGPYRNLDKVQNAYPIALSSLYDKSIDQVKWGARVHHPQAMNFFDLEAIKTTLKQSYEACKAL